MAIRGLRNSLNSIVPNWLSNRRGLNVGFKVLYTFALMGDVLLEQGLEGLRAPWPGKGTPSALPLIGQSRGLVQGETETEVSFATRLRAWLTTWMNAGSTEILAQTIQSYLGNTPTVRIVDRAGQWVIVDPSGNITLTSSNWNWDGVNGHDDQPASVTAGWWSDIWIVVYPAEWAVQPIQVDGSHTPDPNAVLDPAHGIGQAVTPSTASAILSLVSTWKGAHVWVEAIIYTYVSSTFNPLVAGIMPDGTYGNWYKLTTSGVDSVSVQSRDTASRYWEPSQGG